MKLIKKGFVCDDPTPTPSCHASSIILLEDGNALAAWYGGTAEGDPDVLIWCSRRENGIWSKPECVSPEKGISHFNPVLFRMEPDTITLFYKVGTSPATWKTMLRTTKNGGKTWTDAVEMVPGDDSGGRGPVKNKPLRTSTGKILAPGATERGPWRSFIDVFDGTKWTKKELAVTLPNAEQVNVIQPALWEDDRGHIHALLRSNQSCLLRTDSEDFGETWSDLYPTDLPSNNSGMDCIRLENGLLVLACNPVAQDWGKRTPLSIFTSSDNGKTFEKQLDIETEDHEFSYPYLVADSKKLYMTYTWKRKKVGYCEIEL